MTNNNKNDSNVKNSGQKSRNSVKEIYYMSEKYENNVTDKNDMSEISKIDQDINLGGKSNAVKNSSSSSPEVFVDINADFNEDDIPEEVWETESQITERKPSQSPDKPHANVNCQISPGQDHQDATTPAKKSLGSIELCFGYNLSQFKWINITYLVILHTYAIYAYYYAHVYNIKLWTVIWAVVCATSSGFGASAGAHRLWAHRAYKAGWFLKALLVSFESMCVNGSCYSYARDHRNHHKFVDTDADPKNARRGFFFAHVGWWCVKKNPKVIEAGRKLSHQDLIEDKFIMFQHKYYYPMAIFWALIFPVLIPYYCWDEDPLMAFNVCCVLRIVFVLHHLFTVNSIAHIFGKLFSFKLGLKI